MGRLIDAETLKQELYQQWFMDILLTQKRSDDMFYALAQKIDAQPTAYDPDKVVEQLEKLKSLVPVNRVLDDIVNDKPKELGMLIAYEKAIKIVKGECATEQSCEWKIEDSESNLYVTECENRQLIFEGTPEENGYKYCPYCGRKIKRGGEDG
jgi:hypothetical protein|nr:MAG TPA: zinc-ribbon domain protein [Bacteriophage sp.]